MSGSGGIEGEGVEGCSSRGFRDVAIAGLERRGLLLHWAQQVEACLFAATASATTTAAGDWQKAYNMKYRSLCCALRENTELCGRVSSGQLRPEALLTMDLSKAPSAEQRRRDLKACRSSAGVSARNGALQKRKREWNKTEEVRPDFREDARLQR
mmetsp:Transcript_20221/g.51629  ORF Transcript_20221/g.51629 Transcript_20221/m.51629 type:complete len:155 (+) Transcript_20221:56-520(+)